MALATLTVLFTDIVGSTQALASREAGCADRLLTRHFALLRSELGRHRGREVKTLGDGVMATFLSGHQAIAAAIAMQRAVAHDRGAPTASRLSIRVGISSGDVQTREDDCFGIAVVEASRLCTRAESGQVLIADSTRLLARDRTDLVATGEVELKGLPESTRVWEAQWETGRDVPLRVVLADDAALIREGVAHILEAAGMDVVGQAGDPDELMRLVAELRPDLAIVDIRMPPTHTQEGLRAAVRIRETQPQTGVLLLSMDVEPRYASRLLSASPTGVGYLLKESITNLHDFAAAAREVAAGGTAFAPALRPKVTELTFAEHGATR